MPQYSFECQACRKTFEIDVSMSEYGAMRKSDSIACPACGSTNVLRRFFTAPAVTRSSGGVQSGGCGPACGCG